MANDFVITLFFLMSRTEQKTEKSPTESQRGRERQVHHATPRPHDVSFSLSCCLSTRVKIRITGH